MSAIIGALPQIVNWPMDGGPFVTMPQVYTEDIDQPGIMNANLGMYRIHRYDDATTGIHWQIHKGGGYHYYEAEKQNKTLPMTLFIGGPPALMLPPSLRSPKIYRNSCSPPCSLAISCA